VWPANCKYSCTSKPHNESDNTKQPAPTQAAGWVFNATVADIFTSEHIGLYNVIAVYINLYITQSFQYN